MLTKRKARLIYSLNSKAFVGDLLIHYDTSDLRLSLIELIDLQLSLSPLEALKEVANDPSVVVRICVDYTRGLELKRVNCKCDVKFTYTELDLKLYNLADQYDYLDNVFNKFIISDVKKKTVWETKTVFKDYSQLRSYIVSLYYFGVNIVNYIHEQQKTPRVVF